MNIIDSSFWLEYFAGTDSIIYATSLRYNCTLWTQDRHFSGLNPVNYFEKIN